MKKSKTEMIKSKFSNAVHKLLNPNPVKNRDKWKTPKLKLTDEQKIELFDKIVQLDREISDELGSYWYDKREKKRINKKRIERGWKPKKKTTKEQYEKMNQENLVV
jgi:hypothetical protein